MLFKSGGGYTGSRNKSKPRKTRTAAEAA